MCSSKRSLFLRRLKFWVSRLPSLLVSSGRRLPGPSWLGADVFLLRGMGDINWGCTGTMEGTSPNLLGEVDFKWAVVRGHWFCDG